MGHCGTIPEYDAAGYGQQLITANRKFNRLCRFSIREIDAVQSETDDGCIDWQTEMKRRSKALKRWQREITGVLRDLLKMLQDVRQDEALLEFYLDDASDNLRQKAAK
jgi:hypothetical protein